MLLLKIGLFVLAGIGFLAVASFIYFYCSYDPKETNQSKPEYTEEEKFYAELMLMKQDLDADAFRTRQAMHQEFERHSNNNDIADL